MISNEEKEKLSAEKTTPRQFLDTGIRFVAAADDVYSRDKEEYFVFTYLACHSLECLMKSYLNSKNVSVSVLAQKRYGHNLNSLYKLAKDHGLANDYSDHNELLIMAAQTNEWYSNKRLEYLEIGLYTIPDAKKIRLFLDRFVEFVCERIWRPGERDHKINRGKSRGLVIPDYCQYSSSISEP